MKAYWIIFIELIIIMSSTSLAICELFNPVIHGLTDKSSTGICGHFIIHNTVSLDELHDSSFEDVIEMMRNGYEEYLSVWGDRLPLHPIVSNYEAIISGNKNINIDIVVVDELNGSECVGYIKTHWLRIVQRRWKKIYTERQEIIRQRGCAKSILMREATGKWPKELRLMPRFTLGLSH